MITNDLNSFVLSSISCLAPAFLAIQALTRAFMKFMDQHSSASSRRVRSLFRSFRPEYVLWKKALLYSIKRVAKECIDSSLFPIIFLAISCVRLERVEKLYL